MKISILLVLLASSIAVSAQTQQDAVRRRADVIANEGKPGKNTAYYAADPGWRSVTNQIALLTKQRKDLDAQRRPLNEMAEKKKLAGQSYAAERSKIAEIDAKIAPINKKLADLSVKELEAKQRVDAVREAQKRN